MAVCGSTHDSLSAKIAACARAVLNHEGLAEPLRQPLTHQASDDVGRARRGEANDPAHRPRRIGLRPCDARRERDSGSAHCQMEKLAARKFYGDLLNR